MTTRDQREAELKRYFDNSKVMRNTGKQRNLPCPCESGKKVKKCCGSAEKINEFNKKLIELREILSAKQMESNEKVFKTPAGSYVIYND